MAKARITRRKLAAHTARELLLGDTKQAINELAAYLVHTKRVRELDLILRDIEYALYLHGDTVVDVTSAQKLTDALRSEITQLTMTAGGAKKIYLREHVDPTVIGGVRLEFGQQLLDMTIRHKLNTLKAGQI